MTKIDAPWLRKPASRTACDLLAQNGYQIYFVGGCVRNALLDAPVSDLDLATDAHPDTVMSLANDAQIRAIPTGIEHGTVTLVVDDVSFEVTTFRKDVATDGRRATVAFSENLEEDARRRDFTMNALYAAPDGEVTDVVGGLKDLRNGVLRFIDDPNQRIKEDYLRILRFFRFFAWYSAPDQGIDPEGLAACAAHIDGLPSLSKERVGAELLKLLSAPDPSRAMASMEACGALAQILPGATAQSLPILIHNEAKLDHSPDPIRRLATIGGEEPALLLRLSKSDAKKLSILRNIDISAGEAGYRFGELGLDIVCVTASVLGHEVDTNKVELSQKGAASPLPISAQDLMPTFQSAALGERIREIEDRWISSDFTLTKDQLLD